MSGEGDVHSGEVGVRWFFKTFFKMCRLTP
jgi:hypothetical protein